MHPSFAKQPGKTGGHEKGDRITHHIEITALGDIDAEVKRRLTRAHALDA